MNNTAAGVEARFRRLMLARSPEERLAMACDMFATAKALVRASIPEEVGLKGPNQVREYLFLRLYGKDFPENEKAKILNLWNTTQYSIRPTAS